MFWRLIARCALVCLLWGGRGSHGQGGKFEANRVEMQMDEAGGEGRRLCTARLWHYGYLHRCKFLRLVKNTVNFFVLFCWFSFLGETEAGMALAEIHPDTQSTAIFLETVW